MPVGVLTLEIQIPYAHSLKEKRAVLRKMRDRIRARGLAIGRRIVYRPQSIAIDLDVIYSRHGRLRARQIAHRCGYVGRIGDQYSSLAELIQNKDGGLDRCHRHLHIR